MKLIFGASLSFLAQLGPKPLFSLKPGGEWSKPFEGVPRMFDVFYNLMDMHKLILDTITSLSLSEHVRHVQ